MAVRLAVDRGVVHDDDLAVLRHADVELEHVGAGAQRLAERVHRVRRELVLAALVGDVERRAASGSSGWPPRAEAAGEDRGDGGDGQGQESAAHAEQLAAAVSVLVPIAQEADSPGSARAAASGGGGRVGRGRRGGARGGRRRDPGARPRRPHHPFRAHSEYLYLTDRERPGGVLAFDPGEGWVEFVGRSPPRSSCGRGSRATARACRRVRGRWTSSRGGWAVGRCAGSAPPTDADEELRNELIRVRRPKDDVELERMRVAAEATRAGFAELVRLIEPGRTERELQVALEAAFLRSGGDFLAFESIVAAGDHSAVLHFSPTSRELKAGELLLVDAGAEYRGYASDVTRTYPIGGSSTREQRLVWETVRRAGEAAIAACRPASSGARSTAPRRWCRRGPGRARRPARRARDARRERRGDALLPARRRPHGRPRRARRRRGVRRTREPVPGFPRLRLDIPLQPRHAWTVEPGIYFVAPLLARDRDRTDVDWDRVDELLGFGGVRIEQNVLITDDGCEVLTADIPL